MGEETRTELLERYIEHMPSLPPTVAKVVELCNSPNASPTDLNRVISIDPVLMGRVLRLINSAYYGLSTRVVSMVRAIIMLGMNTVKNLALSSAVMETLGKRGSFKVLEPREFWRHSLAVGVTARLIARELGVDATVQEEYFVGGLLHDIGKIPLDGQFPDEYRVALELSETEAKPLYQAEQVIFGFDHQFVGGLIVDAWKLGATVRDMVSNHHAQETYQGDHAAMVRAVHAASYMANLGGIGFAGDRHPEDISATVRGELGLDVERIERIQSRVSDEVRKAEVFLNTR